MKKKIDWKVLILSLVIVYFVAFLGSIFTYPTVNSSWYIMIKPPITPPNWIFPIVWNILFFLIAVSLYLAWINAKNKKDKKEVATVFGINLFLNLFWTILFFGFKDHILSLIEAIALLISIMFMMRITSKIKKTSFYLLIPYLLWVSFALVLNLFVCFLKS